MRGSPRAAPHVPADAPHCECRKRERRREHRNESRDDRRHSPMTRPDPDRNVSPTADALEGGTPHKPADDTEQIYFEGSPMLRGEIGRGILLIIGGLLLIALPVV